MRDEYTALIRRHLEAENNHDLDGTLATLHADCVFEDLATGQVWHGHEGAAAHYLQWWQTLDPIVERGPGQHSWWASEDTYIAEITWRGTHSGDYLSIPPTGRSFVLPGVVFVTFRDNLMQGEKFYYDLASVIRQIAEDPIPATAGLPHRR